MGCGLESCQCATGYTCINNTCVCNEPCGDKKCGEDGCGNSCGQGKCSEGQTCYNGECKNISTDACNFFPDDTSANMILDQNFLSFCPSPLAPYSSCNNCTLVNPVFSSETGVLPIGGNLTCSSCKKDDGTENNSPGIITLDKTIVNINNINGNLTSSNNITVNGCGAGTSMICLCLSDEDCSTYSQQPAKCIQCPSIISQLNLPSNLGLCIPANSTSPSECQN